MADFPDFLIKSDITEVSEWPKCQISTLNVMGILYQRHIAVSKQTTLLAGADVGPPDLEFICRTESNHPTTVVLFFVEKIDLI